MIIANSSTELEFNPFSESVAGEYFVGREEQQRHFMRCLEGLKNGTPQNFYIVGVHGAGKTSYLYKLVEIAKNQSFLATLSTVDDGPTTAHQQVSSILRALVGNLQDACGTRNASNGNLTMLEADWDRGTESTHFSLPKSKHLEGESAKRDFQKMSKIAKETKFEGVIIFIDEGQRLRPHTLSTLKNVLQPLPDYLVVISLRVVDDSHDLIAAGRAQLEQLASDAEGDIGASRFYVKGLPIGAFDTDTEVKNCVMKRLDGNVIQFTDATISRISSMSGRIPRDIVSLSANVYDKTVSKGLNVASEVVLEEAFRENHRSETSFAAEIVAGLSDQSRATLDCLVRIGRPATLAEVVSNRFPDVTDAVRDTVLPAIEGELNLLCGNGSCTKLEDRYQIINPMTRYALSLALVLQ